jgi:FkbM family methyltransferase
MLLNLLEIHEKYKLNIRGVLQIGAHHGQEDWIYRRLGVQNITYFEPLDKNYNELIKNIPKGTETYKLALGNENKKVKMFVESANRGMSSSILKPSIHKTQYPHIVFDEEEEVDMRRLDEIGIDISKYNLINIDVQGYELEVFKGAEKTLNHIDYIISEINKEELYENCTLLDDLTNFLSKYGFELVEQTWAGGNWGDGFFIKKIIR